MPSIASSLFWIALIAAIAPIVAGLIPRRLVPEVVLLLVAGAVVGPFALNIAADSEAIGILRELGLGMLFLLAGYEIDRQELSGAADVERSTRGCSASRWRSRWSRCLA